MLSNEPRQDRKVATVIVMRVPGSGWQGSHPMTVQTWLMLATNCRGMVWVLP